MLCSPGSSTVTMNPRDGFLALVNSSANAAACLGPHRSCGQESSASVTFSWSDFPILGQGSTTTEVPLVLEMEDLWIGEEDSSCGSSNSTCSTSDESMSRHSAISVSSFEDIENKTIQKKPPCKISFSNVLRIRTYDVTLGDHPCCVGGMALTCGWTYGEQDECIDLDVYERYAPKRPMRELRLSYHERRCRLQANLGLSCPQLLQLEYNLVCAESNATPTRLLPESRVHSTSLRDLSSCQV